ncbi:MAG: sulfatase-like hydrolase/transferase [Gammaproteobacteria bacterium]
MLRTIPTATCLALLTALLAIDAGAYQPDAPFAQAQSRNADAWKDDDAEVDRRLAELRERFGKRPNIIYILADDIGWGELGSFLGGASRGTPTPNLDAMAASGLKLMSHYSEPSCTPTRLALLTGRYPVRTGVDIVLWPGQTQGLEPGEVTVAEVLSEAGYDTAMFGKWHVGDLDRHAPERQGFDYAYYGLYNGAIYSWFNQDEFYSGDTVDGAGYFYDMPGTFEDYEKKYGIKIRGHFEGIKGKERKEIEPINATSMEDMERNAIRRIKDYIRDKADSDKPFFVYWASYAQQMAASPREYRMQPGVDRVNNQAAQLAQHDDYMQQLLDTLAETGIAENTLLVWVSDNGPMYAFWPNAGYSWLRGAKGEVYDGGIRTPGIAVWPGMIKPGQDAHDLVSVTDLFTTAARIAGTTDALPNDRIIDGIDQTALLLNGDGHGRRNYMFHYSGNRLAAVRMEHMKLHIVPGSRGGLPNMEVYNMTRDPGEKYGEMYSQLWAVVPFQRLIGAHMGLISKYPHRELPSGTF